MAFLTASKSRPLMESFWSGWGLPARRGLRLVSIEIENVPSENPRTGKLSYLSTIALLRDLSAPLRVGT